MITADNITLSRLEDIEAMLDTTRSTIRRVRLQSEAGDMGPDEAAEIVAETLETLTRYCEP